MKKRVWNKVVLLLSVILFLSWSGEAVLAEESLSKSSGMEETLQEESVLEYNRIEESAPGKDGTEKTGTEALDSGNDGTEFQGPEDGGNEEPGPGDGEGEEPAPEEHSLIKTERKEATCGVEGNIEYLTCETCGKIFLDEAGTKEVTDKTELVIPKLAIHMWDGGKVTKKATCIKDGIRTYTCSICKNQKTEKIYKTGHHYKDKITRASRKKQGKIINRCTVCGKVRKRTVIPRIKKISLSKTTYTYNGKKHAPKVKVVDAKGKKIKSKYYVVKNAKAKNVGTHTVKIIFNGRYKGTTTRKYKINPKAVSGIKVSAGKKEFTVSYKKQSKQCGGYQLQYAKNPKFSGAVQLTLSRGTSKKTVSGLENATTYYVRMRAFKKVKENGKVRTYYSAWSGKKTVTTENVKFVCIDAGHQQRGDSSLEPIGPGASSYKAKVAAGTSGVATGKPEYQLTLEVALKLQQELTRRGYDVLMVRTTHDVNISNSARAAMANNAQVDAFIRIHANGAAGSAANGAITICQTPANPYCGSIYSQCRRLSEQILSHFVAACGCKNGGIWETDTMSGINWCSVPVTILEMGYMTNPAEDRLMSDPAYQDRMVQGIANGLDAYFAM